MSAALKIDYINRKTSRNFHLPLSVFKKPNNLGEYSKLEKILDELIDEVHGNEKHPLAIAMEIIGENLEQYDNEHFPPIGDSVTDIEFVTYLMNSHDLRQIDLAEIFGGQANVSNFLTANVLCQKIKSSD